MLPIVRGRKKNCKKLRKALELTRGDKVTTVQLTNPAAGKGGNRPKADGLGIGSLDEFWLLDVSPKGNAVHVNGDKTRVHSLTNGDRVHIGDANFVFYEGLPRLADAAAKNSRMAASTTKWDARQLDD